jgi:hypothetical protein
MLQEIGLLKTASDFLERKQKINSPDLFFFDRDFDQNAMLAANAFRQRFIKDAFIVRSQRFSSVILRRGVDFEPFPIQPEKRQNLKKA